MIPTEYEQLPTEWKEAIDKQADLFKEQMDDKITADVILKAREVLDKQKVPRPHYIQLPGMLEPEKFEDVLNKKLKLTYTLDV